VGTARSIFRAWRLLPLLALATSLLAVSAKFQDAVKARIDGGYAVVLYANGTKSLIPLSSLNAEDRTWIGNLAAESPLAHGKSEVRVVKEQVAVKNTIAVSTVVGPLETVQLNPPSIFRDQIDATCMLYARVHWLDIAGFYLSNVDLYKIINNSDPNRPWADPFYHRAMAAMVLNFRPIVHVLPPQVDPFTWARGELRAGRPVLAAFPREIWQDLPPGFVAGHPWSGGDVGHQIVINGFTWNSATKSGTFHIINSWKELPEFDLKTEFATGAMVIERSLSPKGEAAPETTKLVVTKVILLSSTGKTKLFEVQTNLGAKRVAAPDEASARAMIESEN
jgi:hypothetical protein